MLMLVLMLLVVVIVMVIVVTAIALLRHSTIWHIKTCYNRTFQCQYYIATYGILGVDVDSLPQTASSKH